MTDKAVHTEPYAVEVPYSTWRLAGSFVLQVIVAPPVVTPECWTALITGGVVSGGASVVNVKSADVARLPAASLLLTRK